MSGSAVLKSARARSLRALHDVFVVVAALALLGAQALSTLHFVLVPHHLCTLHGVLEDGEHGAGATAATTRDDRGSDTATSGAADIDGHDACSVATRPVHVTLPARPLLERAQLDGALVAAVPASLWQKPDRAALLSSAPKTSPPARG